MQLFSFLATPLGFVMSWMYQLLQNYGWTIIIFTFLVRILLLPLTIKQQKSTARMSAYQPMIQEIQKKWANDKNKQNTEMQKFYEENNLKMTGGCLPMLLNMLVLFGIIAVIQAPLTYIIGMPPEQVANGVAIVQQYKPDTDIEKNAYIQQSVLIGEIRNPENAERFSQEWTIQDADGNEKTVALSQEWIQKVEDFNFHFLGMDLSKVPTKVDRSELIIYLILPILSLITMFGSQFIIMRTSGNAQQMKGTMMIMTLVMGAWFGYISFTIPVGFSLYYVASNLVMTGQQLLVRRFYDPEKIRAEVEAEIQERKKAKKAKKKIAIKGADGVVVEQEFSDSELAKVRLARARELDAEKYGNVDEELEKNKDAAEKARLQDEEKYRENTKKIAATEPEPEDKTEQAPEPDAAEEKTKEPEKGDGVQKQEPYKPGRRKRARESKQQDQQEEKVQHPENNRDAQ